MAMVTGSLQMLAAVQQTSGISVAFCSRKSLAEPVRPERVPIALP
jgi:hypothetical protein